MTFTQFLPPLRCISLLQVVTTIVSTCKVETMYLPSLANTSVKLPSTKISLSPTSRIHSEREMKMSVGE